MSAAPSTTIAWLSTTALAHQICVSPGSISAGFGVGDSTYNLEFDIANISRGSGTSTTAVGCLPDFIADVIGYSVSNGPGAGINRILPAKHPECPWLYASKVNLQQGVGPRSTTSMGLGQWKAYRVSVQFETPPYEIIDNAIVGLSEWRRYTYMEADPASEFLTRQGRSFQWPAAAPQGPVAMTGSESASLVQRVNKTKLKLTWFGVPDIGLWGAGGFATTPYSENIESRVGTVNATSFLGRDPGTLLLTGWKPVARSMPVPPNLINGNIPRSWDVDLYFSYFRQDDAVVGVPGVVGHNCAPAPGLPPNGGKWYRPYLQGGADTSQYWRYQESEFSNLFLMNA